MADNNPSTLKGRRFLVAEDEAIIAMLLEDMIEQLGGEIVGTAKACDEALAALESSNLDAIILDVHLKGGTSEDVVAAAAGKSVPVLVCTGSDAQALPPAFRDLPILQKPWQSEDVEIALNQLFNVPA
jgi:CheY-like chemotaxis protein